MDGPQALFDLFTAPLPVPWPLLLSVLHQPRQRKERSRIPVEVNLTTMTNSLAAATCAIYAALAIPVLFLLVRHGRYGLLGWLFLFSFCSLRIVGNGMAVKNPSVTAEIIASVGLSPLLLATAGILHEA